MRFKHGLYSTLFLDLPVFVAATASVSFFYVATMRELGIKWRGRLKYLPFVMSLGIGMAINQCKAVIEALLDQPVGVRPNAEDGLRGARRCGRCGRPTGASGAGCR